MKNQLDKINKNHSFIKQAKFNQDLLNSINYKFRLDWNYYSNHLEGGTLTKEETRSVMVDIIDIRGKSLKDVMEMKGHNSTIEQIIKIGEGNKRISETQIKNIHTAIMYEDKPENQQKIGQWKAKPNEIINYKDEKISFTAPNQVADAMHELLNKTNAQLDAFFNGKEIMHPLEIATTFHIGFLSIHPFYDGNGRTARILTNLILISCGYPPIIIKNEHKTSYYKILADIQAYGGTRSLLQKFMAERLLDSQQLIIDAINGKDIEELDDIDKEISLWKKQLNDNTEIVRLDENEIYGLYNGSLKSLFELFLDKHQQFHEVFVNVIINNRINDKAKMVDDIAWFDEWMSIIPSNLNEMNLNINFNTFKNDGTNTFSLNNFIKINFQEYKYIISIYNYENILTKLYSETLTASEMNEIVKASVKAFFERLKSNLK